MQRLYTPSSTSEKYTLDMLLEPHKKTPLYISDVALLQHLLRTYKACMGPNKTLNSDMACTSL